MTALRAEIDDTLSVPLSGADRALVGGAAAISGKTLDQFVRDAVLRAARQAQADDELLRTGRVSLMVEDLDRATIEAIASSAVPADQAALDDLVKDWNP